MIRGMQRVLAQTLGTCSAMTRKVLMQYYWCVSMQKMVKIVSSAGPPRYFESVRILISQVAFEWVKWWK